MMQYILALLEWCKVQIELLSKRGRNHFFGEREVWWCSIGFNIGEEEFGKGTKFTRPVLVFKKFTGRSFFGIPLTGNTRAGSWYIPLELPGRQSSLMLNQGRTFDSMRLIKKITKISNEEFGAIKKRFIEFYGQ